MINGIETSTQDRPAPSGPNTKDLVPLRTDVAILLLLGKKTLLECWPAEEYLLKRSKEARNKSLANSLVMLSDTQKLAQLQYLRITSRGRRMLGLQDGSEVSIHAVEENPWPYDKYTLRSFASAVTSATQAQCIKPLSLHQVACVVHRVEQAKYLGTLMKQLNKTGLSERAKLALEKQLEDCALCLQGPPAASVLAMVQAASEDKEPGEVSEGRSAFSAQKADDQSSPGQLSLSTAQTKLPLNGNLAHKEAASNDLTAVQISKTALHDRCKQQGTAFNREQDTGGKADLQKLLHSLSPEHEWRAQFEQVIGMDNMLTACIQTCDTIQAEAANNEAAQHAASMIASTVKSNQQELTLRTTQLAAAVLTATVTFAGHSPDAATAELRSTQNESLLPLPVHQQQSHPASVCAVLGRISQILTKQRQGSAPALSSDRLRALSIAQQALEHAVQYGSEIISGLQQHTQALISSQALTLDQARQLKCFLEPGCSTASTSTQSINAGKSAVAKPTGPVGKPAGQRNSAGLDQQKAQQPSIAAQQKRKRIEWDAQVAAATNAQTLRAVALAAHAQKVDASVAKPAVTKAPMLSKARKAGEPKPVGRTGESKLEAKDAISTDRPSQDMPAAKAAVATATGTPPQLQQTKSAPSLAASAGPAAQQSSAQPQAQMHSKLPSLGKGAAPNGQQPVPANAATPDSKRSVHAKAAAPDSGLSAQALVESLPKTPPGTPPGPLSPLRPRQPVSASQSDSAAPEEGQADASAGAIWQGDVVWRWGSDATACGGFRGALTHMTSFPSGSRWNADSELNLELDSHSLQLMELCPFDPTAPNALADTYTGHLFLLSDTSTASMHQGIESMQQGLTDSNKEPQQILTAASAHSGLDVLQRELSYRRLLACLEANGDSLVTQWGSSFHDSSDTSSVLHLLLVACASLKRWLPVSFMKQHELAEIDVLQQNPCTMWALPFIATRSSLPGSALGAPPSAHETAPQPVTDTSSQPQFADKASADSGFPASSESLPQPHRDIAPSGPLAELSSKDAKQTTAASHWVQVRAYQPDNLNAIADNALPSSVPKGLATTSNTTGQQQTAAAAWLESVLADNDTRATSATMLNGIPVHQAAEQSRAVSSSTAAKDAQIHSKVPLGTAGKIQQAKTASQHADRSAAPQAQMEASQSQKQVSQASRTRQEKANPDGRAAPQAQQLAAAGTAPDGVQINTDTAHGGSSAPGLEAAQRSNAAADQSSTPESATRKRDQQQIAGPTRSGSPADSSDLLAKATSEAADAQTNRASKQARARRAKPAAAADSTDSDEGTPREQQDQLSKAEGSGASRTKVAQLTGKRQQREAPDKPVVKKAKQTNSQAASQQKTENGKAAGTGVEKKRQSSKDTSVQKKQSEVKTDLPSQTLDNIFDSLKELGLLRNHHGNGELTRSDIQALDIRPPLLQLRILSWYASKFQTGGNPHRFLQISTTNMVKQSANTNWLAHRSLSSGTPRAHTLSPEAHALHKELLSLRMLPDNAVPEVALQSLPSELHPAYVLALAGYPGKRLQNFAQNLLHSILWQVCRAVQQQNSISHTFQVAMSSYADAVGKPFLPSEGHSGADKGAQPGSSKAAAKGTGNAAAQDTRQGLSSKRKHSPIPIPAPFSKDSKTAPVTKVPTFVNGLPVSSPAPKTGQQHSIDAAPSKPKKPKTRIHLHMSEVAATALDGLIRLRRLQPNSLDDHSLDFLHKQSPLWQMHILSFFSERVNSGNASAYLTSICKANKIAAYNRDFRWVQQTGQIEAHTLTLLNHACMAGLVSQEFVSTVTLQSIPKDLHGIAVCYALGSVSTAPTHQAQQQNGTPHVLQLGTRQAQSAFHTIIQYIHQLLEEEVPNYRPLGPSDPSRPHTAPPSGASSHPPLQAQDSFPSYDRPTSLQHSSSHQHAHNGVQDYNRPCPFYFRSSGGCGNQGCPYIHGTHEKYVAYMKRTGLIPYSLKFQSGLDRDRCVGDDAVDVLNDMMLDKTIPRGSFGDWDLQPLAFLEDPHSANASQLQLQVVQQLSQIQEVSDPAAALADLVQQARDAQAGPTSRAPNAMPAFDAASMPPSYPLNSQHGSQAGPPDFNPYDPFAPDSSSGGPQPSLSDPHGSLHHPAPAEFAPVDFAPAHAESIEESLPFPCFLYEEDLAVALLQNGAVHNVEHLLAVAPGCTMPPEVHDCFQGRWQGDIEGFLLSRPWLFTVTPNCIDVTDHARVGLVYKREVLQALWHALHDNVQLSIGDIAEIGHRLARINDIIADHGGLVKFLSTPLFSEDIKVRFFGPGNTSVMLRPHLADLMRPNF